MQSFLVNLAYKLAIGLAGYIVKAYYESKSSDQRHEVDKQKDALIKAIKEAKTDEDYINLSIVLDKLNRSRV